MEFVNVISKTAIFYILIIIIIRLLGKREVGEISVFDLVVLLIIADVATMAISRDWFYVLLSVASLLTLLGLQKLFAFITLNYPKVRNIVDYNPSIIMYDGKLNISEMKKQSYTMNDLITQARNKDIMDLNEIKMAILESTGQLSIYRKEDYDKIILPVMISGIFQEDNIKVLGLNILEVQYYLQSIKLEERKVNYLSSDGKEFYLIKLMNCSCYED